MQKPPVPEVDRKTPVTQADSPPTKPRDMARILLSMHQGILTFFNSASKSAANYHWESACFEQPAINPKAADSLFYKQLLSKFYKQLCCFWSVQKFALRCARYLPKRERMMLDIDNVLWYHISSVKCNAFVNAHRKLLSVSFFCLRCSICVYTNWLCVSSSTSDSSKTPGWMVQGRWRYGPVIAISCW